MSRMKIDVGRAMASGAHGKSPGIPIISHHDVCIDHLEQKRLQQIASRLIADEPALASTDAFGPGVSASDRDGIALIIGDHSDTALMPPEQILHYDYRLSALAAEGDHLVIWGEVSSAFETYRQSILQLGSIQAHKLPQAKEGRRSWPPESVEGQNLVKQLISAARKTGRLAIIPYQGTGGVWRLAMKLAETGDIEVNVMAAPPRLARRANDKIWFGRRVVEVLGTKARPVMVSAYGPAALAAKVAAFARKHESVVMKVPSSAGSFGNFKFEANEIKGLSLGTLRHKLVGLLHDRGWHDRYPLLIEVWDCSVISTPSIQIWIPQTGNGLPIVEGIFEQLVEGPEGQFIGALPAKLSDLWIDRIVDEGSRLAILLQQIGYVGRCSFDAVIFGDDLERAALHWIECNGRWGGTSIPMTLVNRLTGDWSKTNFIIYRCPVDTDSWSFDEALEKVSEFLYCPGKRDEGIVFLMPGLDIADPRVHLIAIGKTHENAMQFVRKTFDVLGDHARYKRP